MPAELSEGVLGLRNSQGTLAWAVWVVARLAGWSGDRFQHPAKVVTMHRGLAEI